MRPLSRKVAVGLFVACLVFAASTAIASIESFWMNVDELKPEMTGYGLSVFKGETPEKFPIEVIDVLHQFRPNQDLILIRTPGPLLTQARGVAGMSGSPIYIEGKLVGAYAYGWSNAIEPVIGVTPIRSMLAELKRVSHLAANPLPQSLAVLPHKALRSSRSSHSSDAVRMAGMEPYAQIDENPDKLWARLREGVHKLGARVEPAQTPIMLSGFDSSSEAWLSDQLSDLGMITLQGGQPGANPNEKGTYQNGGAISVQLIRGDLSASAIGTITHISKDGRILAFGHPMLDAGPLGFPAGTARVVHIFSSHVRSFKLAEALAPQGMLVQDRLPAIIVDPKQKAKTIAVKVQFHGVDDAPKTTWNMQVARHRILSSMFVLSAISSAFSTTAHDREPGWYQATTEVQLAGHKAIRVQDAGVIDGSQGSLDALQDLRLFPVMEASMANPFEEAWIDSISIDITLKPKRVGYLLRTATPASSVVDAGDQLPIHLHFLNLSGGEFDKTIKVTIPKNAAGQTLLIQLQRGGAVQRYLPVPTNLDQLLAQITDTYSDTEIVASIRDSQPTLRFSGNVATQLPTTIVDTLAGAAIGRPLYSYQRAAFDFGAPVGGSATVSVDVRAYAESENR